MLQKLLSGFPIDSDALGEIRASEDALISVRTGKPRKLEPRHFMTARNTPGKCKDTLLFSVL